MSRSIWKPIVFNRIPNKDINKNRYFKDRSCFISKNRVGYLVHMYNGNGWYAIRITSKRIGHRRGEFASTRKRPALKKKNEKKIKNGTKN